MTQRKLAECITKAFEDKEKFYPCTLCDKCRNTCNMECIEGVRQWLIKQSEKTEVGFWELEVEE